jgi:hypothetical protein
VRELESEISRLLALSAPDVPCDTDLLNERIRNRGNGQSVVSSPQAAVVPMPLHAMEKQLVFSAVTTSSALNLPIITSWLSNCFTPCGAASPGKLSEEIRRVI